MAVLEVKDVGYYYFSDKPVLKGEDTIISVINRC